MSDQCVPSSVATVEESTELQRCSIVLRKRGKHFPEGGKIIDSNATKLKTRKKITEERGNYARVPNVRVAHKKAKRRCILKDKKRELHRQNERYRHQSVNMAIQELSQLVPCSELRRNDTKQNIVKRTGEYMEHLNNKVAAMCEHLSCSKKLCHDSLVFNRTLTAVFDGHEEQFSAVKPINLSNLEELLDNMYIGNRIYKSTKLATNHSLTMSGEANKITQRGGKHSLYKVKAKEKTEITDVLDEDTPRGQPFISHSFQGEQSFTSPSSTGITLQMNEGVVTPGYLGDGEDSVSPLGTASSNYSSSMRSSDDVSDGCSTDDVATSSVETLLSESSLAHIQRYSPSRKLHTPKSIMLLNDEPGDRQDQVERVKCVLDTQQLASCNSSFQIGSVGLTSPVSSNVAPSVLPQFFIIPKAITKVLQFVPGGNMYQDPNRMSSQTRSGVAGDETSAHSKENQPEMKTVLCQVKDSLDQTVSLNDLKGNSNHSSNIICGKTSASTFRQNAWSDGYNLFFKIHHPHFQQAWPHLDSTDVTNLVTQAWNDLTDQVRNIYSEKANDCNQAQQKPEKQT